VKEHLRPALVSLAAFTLLCGVIYPIVMTIIAAPFPDRSTELVGQPFDEARYFWSRPTAIGYNALTSAGVNTGPSGYDKQGRLVPNPALVDAVTERIANLRAADPGNTAKVPIDLVTASSSGLDPEISPAAAYYQVPRVARARGIPEAEVRSLVEDAIEERTGGILGERRVNVVGLNRTLDARQPR
jgi:K+-transporting ATPase ATPase C chain